MNRIKNTLKQLSEIPIIAKYNALILPLTSVFICILLLIFIIIPHVLIITKSNSIAGANKEKFNSLNNKLTVLNAINQNEYKENIKTALLAVPPEKDIPGALNQLLFLLGNSKLELDSIGFSSSQDQSANKSGGKNEAYQIKVGTSGSVQALKDFILNIKKTPRIMQLDTLEVTGGKNTGTIQASMSITTYFQPPPTNIGDIEQPISSLNDADKIVLTQIKSYQQNMPAVASTETNVARGKVDPFQ